MSSLQTALGSRFSLSAPIFSFAHSIDVTIAVTNAGGFGVYGATRDTPEEIEYAMKTIRERVGDKRFGVDLVLPKNMPSSDDRAAIEAEIPHGHRQFVGSLAEKYSVPKSDKPGLRSKFVRSEEMSGRQIEAVLASDVDLFACGIGAPSDMVKAAKKGGKTTLALIGAPEHAESALSSGAEILVAQGYDAGAHTGTIGTMSLIPQIVEMAGPVPVLAAGGIATGGHIAASYALGAQGVWLGTVWLGTREHGLSDIMLRKVLAARSKDAVISRSDSGKTLRMLRSAWSDEWAASDAPSPLKMPYQDILVGDLLGAIDEYQIEDLMHYPAGQSVAFVKSLRTVAEVFDELVTDGEACLSRLFAQSQEA